MKINLHEGKIPLHAFGIVSLDGSGYSVPVQQTIMKYSCMRFCAVEVLSSPVLQLTLKYRATTTPNGKMTAKATHMQMPCALAASTVSRLEGPEPVLVLANGWEVELKSMVKGCRFV